MTHVHDQSIGRMPAEWERHRATWLAWPHQESDWPGKLETVDWVYAEVVRKLVRSEQVELLVDPKLRERASHCLKMVGCAEGFRLHELSYDRSWLRDSAPTAVRTVGGAIHWIQWRFNAWAKYDNFISDAAVPDLVAKISNAPLVKALRPDTKEPLVLEGGAIDSDGQGTLLTTEECLLSEIQCRNPGLDRAGYERAFKKYLGIEKTIWLGESCEGDDTHGHIDDVARFVAPETVVLSYVEDPTHPNHRASIDNFKRLRSATDARGKTLTVVKLPSPERMVYGKEILPASYANFYIGNTVVLVPTFNDKHDLEALSTLRKLFPTREVIGIHAVDYVLGFGTLHCSTQQEPHAAP